MPLRKTITFKNLSVDIDIHFSLEDDSDNYFIEDFEILSVFDEESLEPLDKTESLVDEIWDYLDANEGKLVDEFMTE